MEKQSEFSIGIVDEHAIKVGAAGCDVVIRAVDDRLTVKVLAYIEERAPDVEMVPCWPTEVIYLPEAP